VVLWLLHHSVIAFCAKKQKKINIRVSKSVQNSKKLKIFEKKEMFYAF